MPHTTGRIAIRCYKFEFLLRPLRSLRLISESDYSYFVTFVPFVVVPFSDSVSALPR